MMTRFSCERVRRPSGGCMRASAQQMIEPASATPVGPMPEILRQYAPVTAARLKIRRTQLADVPPTSRWVTARSGDHAANVGRLQPVWSFATGQIEGHEAPPVGTTRHVRRHAGNQLLALERRPARCCAI